MNRESIKTWIFYICLALAMGFIVWQTVTLTNRRIDRLRETMNETMSYRAEVMNALALVKAKIMEIEGRLNVQVQKQLTGDDDLDKEIRDVRNRVWNLEYKWKQEHDELDDEMKGEHYSPSVPSRPYGGPHHW